MSRYAAIHIFETADGGVYVTTSGLPPSDCAQYADLSPSQQLAAHLMVQAGHLTDNFSATEATPGEDDDAKADRQVA